MLARANSRSGKRHSLRSRTGLCPQAHSARTNQPNSIVTRITDKNARNGLE